MEKGQCTVLIIDDNKTFGDTVKNSLVLAGYEVLTASSAREGLRILKNEAIDLILLDYRLPNIDGLEFIEDYKEKYHAVPIILMTAYDSDKLAHKALEEGAKYFLRKPFGRDELLSVIGNQLTALTQQDSGREGKTVQDILLVDDDPAFWDFCNEVLPKDKYSLMLAISSKEAISFAQKQQFDLILLNVMLPAHEGVSAFYELQRIDPSTPIIFVTGFSNPQATQQMLDKGAFAVVDKSTAIGSGLLIQQIKEILS